MDTTRKPVSRSWWEARPPALFILLGVLAILRIVVAWVEPGHTVAEATVWTIGAGIFAILVVTSAIATLVKHRGNTDERAPLAQESDPRLRHNP